jgi:hypothetical protein
MAAELRRSVGSAGAAAQAALARTTSAPAAARASLPSGTATTATSATSSPAAAAAGAAGAGTAAQGPASLRASMASSSSSALTSGSSTTLASLAAAAVEAAGAPELGAVDPAANQLLDPSGQRYYVDVGRWFLASAPGGQPALDMGPYADTWRNKDRMKTVSVALMLCLNIGVDPPDIIKTKPCARLECWIDPLSQPAPRGTPGHLLPLPPLFHAHALCWSVCVVRLYGGLRV